MRYQGGERPYPSRRPMRKRGGQSGMPPPQWSQDSMGYRGGPPRGGGGGRRGSRGGGFGGGRGSSYGGGNFYSGPPSFRGGYGDSYGFGGGRGASRNMGYMEERGSYRGGRGSFRGERGGGFRGSRGFGERGGFRGRGSFRGDKGFPRGRGLMGRGRGLPGRLGSRGRGRGSSLSNRSLKINVNDDGASFVADFQESFPCYLSALKNIVTDTLGVSEISQLTVQCDSAAASNAALEALQQIELDGNKRLSLKLVTPSRIDPLRKIAHITAASVDLDNLKTICEAASAETMKRWDGRVVKNLYVLHYSTEEDSEAAQQKSFTYGEETFQLRNYKKKIEGEAETEKVNGEEKNDVEMAEVEETDENVEETNDGT